MSALDGCEVKWKTIVTRVTIFLNKSIIYKKIFFLKSIHDDEKSNNNDLIRHDCVFNEVESEK